MYYPFFRLKVWPLSFAIVLLFTAFSQQSVLAQSDESVALQSRKEGLEFQNRGEYRKAIFYYQRALTFDPENAAIYNDIGLMNEYIGENKSAEVAYLKAISLDHDYLGAYSNLGMFYSKQGQYAMAAKYLRERVQRGRADDPWTLKAQEELERVYQFVPALKEARIKEEADRMAEKIAFSKEKIRKTAAREKALGFQMAYEKGIQAFEARRYDEAIEYLGVAVSYDPRSAAARHALQRAEYDKEKALLDIQAGFIKEETKDHQVQKTLDGTSGH